MKLEMKYPPTIMIVAIAAAYKPCFRLEPTRSSVTEVTGTPIGFTKKTKEYKCRFLKQDSNIVWKL